MIRNENDIDAAILWVLHERFGFGRKRLREFYDAFSAEHNALAEWYDMPHETPYICRQRLLKIGVDVDAWNDAANVGKGVDEWLKESSIG